MVPRISLCVAIAALAIVWSQSVFAQNQKLLARQLRAVVKTELGQLITDIKGKSLALNVVTVDNTIADTIADAIGAYVADVAACVDTAKNSIGTALLVMSPLAAGDTPMDYYLGGTGAVRLFLDRVDTTTAKVQKKLIKAVSKAVRVAAKINPDIRITFWAKVADVTHPPETNGNVYRKALAITAIAAASDVAVAQDGRLCVDGLADPAEGDVTVTVVDIDGNIHQQVGSVNGSTCRWNVCFSSLKEWVSVMVLAEQAGGDSAVVAGIGIP